MLFVDGGNNVVGIGANNNTSYDSIAQTLLVANESGHAGITIRGGGTNPFNGIHFSDGVSGNSEKRAGRIMYQHEHDVMVFQTANAEKMRIDATGAVTKPLQPAFLAQPASQQNNVSSDDTIAFGTEIFDQNADFASNTFTAPVTGKYQLSVALRMDNIDAACDYFRIGIHTSNRNYFYLFEPDIGTSAGQDITRFPAVLSILADMDASDTATVVVNFSGGTAQTDIITDSYFSVFLAC